MMRQSPDAASAAPTAYAASCPTSIITVFTDVIDPRTRLGASSERYMGRLTEDAPTASPARSLPTQREKTSGENAMIIAPMR